MNFLSIQFLIGVISRPDRWFSLMYFLRLLYTKPRLLNLCYCSYLLHFCSLSHSTSAMWFWQVQLLLAIAERHRLPQFPRQALRRGWLRQGRCHWLSHSSPQNGLSWNDSAHQVRLWLSRRIYETGQIRREEWICDQTGPRGLPNQLP